MPKQRPLAVRLEEAQARVDYLRAQLRLEKERDKVKEMRKSQPRRRRRS